MRAFQRSVGVEGGYDELWKWSVDNADEFWSALMGFLEVESSGDLEPVKKGSVMPDVEYFPNARLNFAENLLRHGAPGSPLASQEAVVSVSEARGGEATRWSFAELRDDAMRVREQLASLGVASSDACGAWLPNVGETIVAMLGATSLGATWTSCSPDFGAQAVADRFGQVEPKVLFACDGFVSAGKPTSVVDKLEELIEALPSLKRVVLVRMLDDEPQFRSERARSLVTTWDDFIGWDGQNYRDPNPAAEFDRVPFSHPQFVLYSSGTTGMPKSIAHGAGNTLLQHGKELILHSDLRPKDKMLFYTTCARAFGLALTLALALTLYLALALTLALTLAPNLTPTPAPTQLRLDDVELDGLVALRRSDGRLLRRLRRLPEALLAVGPHRQRGSHARRHLAALPAGVPQARSADAG